MKSSRAMRIEKEKGAFVSESALHIEMAVSRILSHSSLRAKKLGDDHLSQSRLRGTARSRNCGTVMRRTRGSTDRLSSLCFVLHRMGFFLPRELLRER